MSDLPKDLLRNFGVDTARQFKQCKRQEFRQVKKALAEFNCGSVFVPEYEKYEQARRLLQEVEEAMSVRNWGR